MRIRNNKLINFILEFSQIMLVFLGVYSALMCTASSLDMIYDGKLCLLLLFAVSIVFYGLFTVLETFRKGKLYGLIGITMFFLVLVIRFKGALLKGIVSAANSFLKEFMNYTGTNVSLLSYTDTESASAKFCTTLLLILIGVYFVALISAFFYRRRRSVVFLAGRNAEHDHTQWCDYRLPLDDGRTVRSDAGGYHCIRQKCERVCDSVVRVHGVRGCLQSDRNLPCRKRRRGKSAV